MCLVLENETARLMRISTNSYEVIEDGAVKPFDSFDKAKMWFELISE